MKNKIKKLLSEVKENSILANTLSDDADIINDVGLDSLQLINFVLKIEEEFDIELDFEDLDYSHLTSISSLCEFISEQKAKQHDDTGEYEF